MEKNKSRFIIWLLIVIIILLVIAVVALAYKKSNLSDTNITEEIKNTASENIEPEIKEVVKEVEKPIFVKFDNSKIKNDDRLKLNETLVRLGAPLDSADISLIGSVNVKIVKENISKKVPVTNLSGKAVDAIGGPIGDGANSIMYLLMEDGTVEYTEDLWSATTWNYKTLDEITEIKAVGKVEGLSDIVRICYLNDNMAGVPIAIDKDGYSYSLTGIKIQRRGLDF